MALTPLRTLGDLILVVLHGGIRAAPEVVAALIEELPGVVLTVEDLARDGDGPPTWRSRLTVAYRHLRDDGLVHTDRRRWVLTPAGEEAADGMQRHLAMPIERTRERDLGLRSVIARPLLDPESRERLFAKPVGEDDPIPVVIELNVGFSGGVDKAWETLNGLLAGIDENRVRERLGEYVRMRLSMPEIRELARLDDEPEQGPDAIYRIWPNFPVKPLVDASARTVKADAARRAFAACGRGIRWAVVDSGIDAAHPHFQDGETVRGDDVLMLHRDFTQGIHPGPESMESALTDGYGHGTHVAGIIAGHLPASFPPDDLQAITESYSESNDPTPTRRRRTVDPALMSGMAPLARLVSLKVLRDDGDSDMLSVLAALRYVRELNVDNDKVAVIHGVNISLGYEFDPEWFACGQSPLCKEVDRLVRSGVVVVVAAGNTGYGRLRSWERQTDIGLTMTINDPGNAERAITVGSTHRDAPHTYGVSYFSSKGPTGDGRPKPDLVAPGERITSCSTGRAAKKHGFADVPRGVAAYHEDTGTSFAAPHVSGVIAALLSVRPEFVNRPDEVKKIFVEAATTLGRERYFEGAGLVDLMRALQAV